MSTDDESTGSNTVEPSPSDPNQGEIVDGADSEEGAQDEETV